MSASDGADLAHPRRDGSAVFPWVPRERYAALHLNGVRRPCTVSVPRGGRPFADAAAIFRLIAGKFALAVIGMKRRVRGTALALR